MVNDHLGKVKLDDKLKKKCEDGGVLKRCMSILNQGYHFSNITLSLEISLLVFSVDCV